LTLNIQLIPKDQPRTPPCTGYQLVMTTKLIPTVDYYDFGTSPSSPPSGDDVFMSIETPMNLMYTFLQHSAPIAHNDCD
jgi:hypothetical protein